MCTQLLAVTLTNLRFQILHPTWSCRNRDSRDHGPKCTTGSAGGMQASVHPVCPKFLFSEYKPGLNQQRKAKGLAIEMLCKGLCKDVKRASHQRGSREKLPTGGEDSTQEQRDLLSCYKTCMLSAWF